MPASDTVDSRKVNVMSQAESHRDKIVRRQFLGSWVLFWVLCITILGIPIAVLYLIDGMVTIEQQVEDANAVMEIYRQR